MGIVSKVIGIAMSVTGLLVFTYGMNTGGDWLFFIIGMAIMSLGISLLTNRGAQAEVKPPPPTVTEIRCDSPECSFKEIRDFEKGDYILKPLEAKCPKCQSNMTIEGVYIVREEPEEKYNV